MQNSHNYFLVLELSRSECVFRIERTCFADCVLPEVVAVCSVAGGSVECWTECGPCLIQWNLNKPADYLTAYKVDC